MVHPLDDSTLLKRLDTNEMLKVIESFPESSLNALKAVEGYNLNVEKKDFRNVVIAGMGGSAIGGILLRDWLQPTSHIPIIISKQYTLPAYVNEDTLLLAVSYSGNTEETLSALIEAKTRQASVITFTSGGTMANYAKQEDIPCVKLPEGFQPRAAISYQFFSLAAIARKLGLVEGAWNEVNTSINLLVKLRSEMASHSPYDSNLAKQIASQLKGYIPFIYGSSIHEGVAYRWNTQINENSKIPAGSSNFPEAFHNAVMASEADAELLNRVCAILLLDPYEQKETAAKTQLFRDILARRFGRLIEVQAYGKDRLSRIMSTLYIGDFVSAYLGLLNGKNPSSIDSISELKRAHMK
jgi:glucose/mannose-6-phosphate isomerase